MVLHIKVTSDFLLFAQCQLHEKYKVTPSCNNTRHDAKGQVYLNYVESIKEALKTLVFP